jgi:pre-mRNA-splicing factor 38A
MANVTDPLTTALHGTDPQNLMEYIFHQKIHDSQYWKEECFGLTVVNVLEKAFQLQNIREPFDANHQPTKFLCLVLKLLQIQPKGNLMDEFISQEDFKYVQAFGAFYKRLTSRPADIYEKLEPLTMIIVNCNIAV